MALEMDAHSVLAEVSGWGEAPKVAAPAKTKAAARQRAATFR